MPSELTIATWNAGHRVDAWPTLRAIDADVVLAQELPAPPAEDRSGTAYEPFESGTRAWGTAVWSRRLDVRRLTSTTSETAPRVPGTIAVAELALPSGGVLTAISVHA